MRRLRASILIVSATALITALWLFLSSFYFEKGPYQIGCRNRTADTILKNVTIRLMPEGELVLGDLDRGDESWLLCPGWPAPAKVSVSFIDPHGNPHMLSTTGAPPEFRGRLCVVISKPNDYEAHLELEWRK